MRSSVHRRLVRLLALFTIALVAGLPRASAQAPFPVKPVRVVVGFATGGANDLFIRALTPEWSAHLGQPVLVDNRPGAAGQIANELVMRAPADGYTLLLGSSSAFTILPNLQRGTPYDPVRDYTPVGTFARAAHVLVANTNLPARTVAELIALARSRPGEINFGSAGNGSILHLDMELFMSMAGVRLTHIPYKGSEPALADLLGNRIQLLWTTESQVLPQVKLGQLRALAISAIGNGSARYPGIPTMDRAGVKGYDIYNWFGLFAPAGTPAGVIDQLNRSLDLALREPAAIQRLDAAGAEPFAGSPQDLARLLVSETAKIRHLVRVAGLESAQ